jgi:hypothetical protein
LSVYSKACHCGYLIQSAPLDTKPKGAGKTILLKSLFANYPGLADKDFELDSGSIFWGSEAHFGHFPRM